MKWTTIVNHSPYEKTTPELILQKKERLEKLEEEFKKFEYMHGPERLQQMEQLIPEMIQLYDLSYLHGERSWQSMDTIEEVVKMEIEKSLEEEELSDMTSYSSEESLYDQDDIWKKEDKRVDLFDVSISIDEDAEHLWREESSSTIVEPNIEYNISSVNTLDDLIVHATTNSDTEEKPKWDFNMFKNFINKTDEEIRQQWEKDKKRVKPVNIIDTDEVLVNEIAEELCEWTREVGMISSILTVETISDLFRFKFTDNVVVESMMPNIKQLQNVPTEIVKHIPWESTRAELYRQIIWDKLEYDRPDQKLAFMTKFNKKKRDKPDPIKEWIDSDSIPEDLITTESFFKNIIETGVLENFVLWLLENPEAYCPNYLRNIGYVDYIRNKNGGIDKIMREKYTRKNRERFQASKFINKEEAFYQTIRRMSDIRRLIPTDNNESQTSF